MGYYNEAGTRARLIDPKVKLAGWGEGQIEREHYFLKGRALGAFRGRGNQVAPSSTSRTLAESDHGG